MDVNLYTHIHIHYTPLPTITAADLQIATELFKPRQKNTDMTTKGTGEQKIKHRSHLMLS